MTLFFINTFLFFKGGRGRKRGTGPRAKGSWINYFLKSIRPFVLFEPIVKKKNIKNTEQI